MPATRRRQFGGRARPATDWGRVILPSVTVGAATKALLGSFALSNPGIGETVRRTRGRFHVVSDQGSVTEVQNGALGFIVVNDLALAAGAASIPGPVTDAADDGWFVWEGFSQVTQLTVGVANAAGTMSLLYEFDSKAMRKVADGFSIAIMFESLSQGLELGAAVSLLGSRT